MTGVGELDFRHALGTFATGVTVVTCLGLDGADHAMTANAVTSVSLEPPLILVAVARPTRFWEAITRQQDWAVSVLDETAQPHAAWFATTGRPLEGQMDGVPHSRTEAGIALIDQSVAWLECRTTDIVSAGDHDLVLGEVMSARLAPESTGALLYWRSQYRALGRS